MQRPVLGSAVAPDTLQQARWQAWSPHLLDDGQCLVQVSVGQLPGSYQLCGQAVALLDSLDGVLAREGNDAPNALGDACKI